MSGSNLWLICFWSSVYLLQKPDLNGPDKDNLAEALAHSRLQVGSFDFLKSIFCVYKYFDVHMAESLSDIVVGG